MSATFDIVRSEDSNLEAPTMGELLVEGEHFCWTLEDPWLGNSPFISCIPTGVYRVVSMYSARFGKDMPRLIGVPNRTGILIHNGNTDLDTEGCILLGETKGVDAVGSSVAALARFEAWFQSVGNVATLTISSPSIPQETT